MTQVLLFLAWVVLGLGGGAVCGWNLHRRNWPLATAAGAVALLGIVAGKAAGL